MWTDCPTPDEWESRERWFDELDESLIAPSGSYLVSEQACALAGEVRTAFCAGAWVAVIIMAMAVIDAQFRETELPDFKGNTKQLLHVLNADPLLQTLRERRNALVHVDCDNPAITVDDMWSKGEELEREARSAITLMLEAFYMNPAV